MVIAKEKIGENQENLYTHVPQYSMGFENIPKEGIF